MTIKATLTLVLPVFLAWVGIAHAEVMDKEEPTMITGVALMVGCYLLTFFSGNLRKVATLVFLFFSIILYLLWVFESLMDPHVGPAIIREATAFHLMIMSTPLLLIAHGIYRILKASRTVRKK